MVKDWKAYVTYYSDDHISEYNLKETENIKLINVSKDLPKENINHINRHYSELVQFYYIWKNQIKSDYVCMWDHRRYLTPIGFDKLDDNYIQTYFHAPYTDKTPFEFMIYEGVNEYIIYQFIKYMIEKRGIDHDKIIDLIYNHPWGEKIWFTSCFNCNWKVFNDICEFTFDFVDYIIPNGKHTDYKSIEQFIKDMSRSMRIVRLKTKEGEISEPGRIEFEDRAIGTMFEVLYPLFCELMGYKSFSNYDDKYLAVELYKYNKNTIYNKVVKWVHKNVYTGCRKFIVITSEDKKEELTNILIGDFFKWYKIFHAPLEIYTKSEFDNYYSDKTGLMIKLNEYIDNASPIDPLDKKNIKIID